MTRKVFLSIKTKTYMTLDKHLPSLHGVKRESFEEYSNNIRVKMGKYYDNLDFEIYKLEIMIKSWPGTNKIKSFFSNHSMKRKLKKLKKLRKKNPNVLYMDLPNWVYK